MKLGSGDGVSVVDDGVLLGIGVAVRVGAGRLGACSAPGPGTCASMRAIPTPPMTAADAAAPRAGERGLGTTRVDAKVAMVGGFFPPDLM
ncbi:MAG: hypothetical protein KDB50_07595 [Mycobacterium sp.]|nr:hypothetical protein [Mycobacterium sp.]